MSELTVAESFDAVMQDRRVRVPSGVKLVHHPARELHVASWGLRVVHRKLRASILNALVAASIIGLSLLVPHWIGSVLLLGFSILPALMVMVMIQNKFGRTTWTRLHFFEEGFTHITQRLTWRPPIRAQHEWTDYQGIEVRHLDGTALRLKEEYGAKAQLLPEVLLAHAPLGLDAMRALQVNESEPAFDVRILLEHDVVSCDLMTHAQALFVSETFEQLRVSRAQQWAAARPVQAAESSW